MLPFGYSTELKYATVETASLDPMRDITKFESMCRSCPAYGARWGCPPLSQEILMRPLSYKYATIVAVKITPDIENAPLELADKLLIEVRRKIEPQLLAIEKATAGYAAVFTGRCYHCGTIPCTRPSGLPCRHPDLVRPSLESLGYDVSKITTATLGVSLLWGRDGHMPEYLTLVGAVFHDLLDADFESLSTGIKNVYAGLKI